MTGRNYLVCFVAFILAAFLYSAGNGYEPVKTLPYTARYFTTDNLGNFYLVSGSNNLDKYNNKGEFSTTINIKLLGVPASVDVSNPFDIYLFYREQNRLVFLDNILTTRGNLDFTAGGLGQISAAARSFDNGIWAFDLNDLQLKKLDRSLKVQVSSGNTLSITSGSLLPNLIIDNQDRVYMNNPETGILVFDAFANYMKTIPLKGLNTFQVSGDNLIYYQKGRLKLYDMRLFKESEMPLPDTAGVVNIRVEKERLYILKPDTLNLYSF